MVALTFGGSLRISKTIAYSVQYPLPSASSSVGAIEDTIHQPASEHFFVAFCKLHCVLGDVLETFHLDGEDDAVSIQASNLLSASKLERLFQIERDLLGWNNELGPHLRWPSSPLHNLNKQDCRRRHVLHARYVQKVLRYSSCVSLLMRGRYHYTRLLLYRKYVIQAKQFDIAQHNPTEQDASTVSSCVVAQCQTLCTEAAKHLLGVLFDTTPTDANSHRDILPEWWHTLSCKKPGRLC